MPSFKERNPRYKEDDSFMDKPSLESFDKTLITKKYKDSKKKTSDDDSFGLPKDKKSLDEEESAFKKYAPVVGYKQNNKMKF